MAALELLHLWGIAGLFVAVAVCSLFFGRAERLRAHQRGEPTEANWYMEYLPSLAALYAVGNVIAFQELLPGRGLDWAAGIIFALTAVSAILLVYIAGIVIAGSNYRKHPALSAVSLLMILTILAFHLWLLGAAAAAAVG